MMDRRSFSKLAGGLLLVPLLKVEPAIDRHKLLMMFVADEEYSRWDLTRPYVLDQYSYTTDSRTLARIKTLESEVDDEKIRIPPIQGAWDKVYHAQTAWKPFRLADRDELQQTFYRGVLDQGICPECFDRRIQLPYYPLSEEQARQLPQYDVDTNTIGDVTCELCHGLAYYGGWVQDVDGLRLSCVYAHKLSLIPGCEYSIGLSPQRDGTNTVLFRSEVGIEGALCTMERGAYA